MVVEVDRPNRQLRRRVGKSDSLEQESFAILKTGYRLETESREVIDEYIRAAPRTLSATGLT